MNKNTIVMKRLASLALVVLLSAGSVFAQGKFGADSAECVKYLSFYNDYYKQFNNKASANRGAAFEDAIRNWRKAYAICPGTASQNMFQHGSNLLLEQISRSSSDKAYVAALADSLITLQNQRLQFYPKSKNKVSILNNKGNYIVRFKGEDKNYVLNELEGIIAQLGGKTNPTLLVFYLQAAIDLYRAGEISADKVIEIYGKTGEVLDSAEAANEDEAATKNKVRSDLESLFAESKVADCENLINIFGPRYEADPDNVALITSIVKLMSGAEDCLDNDLYLRAVTSLHKNAPSYNSAYFLYKLHSSRGNTSEAVAYLQEAIDNPESGDEQDAQFNYEMANYCLKNGMRGKSFSAAQTAAQLGYGFTGKAYFLIGTLWGSTPCGGNEVTSRARYWVAVDYLQKAKNVDPSLEADANKLIGSYASYYPQAAEAFMYDLAAGQSYTVSCGGMTATTTVRVSR